MQSQESAKCSNLLYWDSFSLTDHTCTCGQVVTDRQKVQILEGSQSSELHVGSGHFGRDKTLDKIFGMLDNVKNFCKTCDKCHRVNRYLPEILVLLNSFLCI